MVVRLPCFFGLEYYIGMQKIKPATFQECLDKFTPEENDNLSGFFGLLNDVYQRNKEKLDPLIQIEND